MPLRGYLLYLPSPHLGKESAFSGLKSTGRRRTPEREPRYVRLILKNSVIRVSSMTSKWTEHNITLLQELLSAAYDDSHSAVLASALLLILILKSTRNSSGGVVDVLPREERMSAVNGVQANGNGVRHSGLVNGVRHSGLVNGVVETNGVNGLAQKKPKKQLIINAFVEMCEYLGEF